MPHSELHKRKLRKNLAILALIACFGLMVWAITVIRITQGLANAG